MEGSYFYFFSWVGWVIATFFMKKDNRRLLTALAILLLLAGSQTIIPVGAFRISASYFILGVICLAGISKAGRWQKLYVAISALIVAMLYAIFHFIEIYDPVWIRFERTWFLSGVFVYASLLLVRHHMMRIFVIGIGAIQGEGIVTVVLYQYGLHTDMGAGAFFDIIACSIGILCVFYAIYNGFSYMMPLKQKYVRERQG
ncbi:MAG: hypothetical protein ACE3JP_02000 [Ectobacillus sp.]